jgi:hypothetical protein
MSKLSHLTPEQKREHIQALRREQQKRHVARMSPEKREARRQYLRDWHEARKAGQLFGRSKLPAEVIRARKNERERQRRERMRAGRPVKERLSPEDMQARKREYNRAYWLKRQAAKPAKLPRPCVSKNANSGPAIRDCAKRIQPDTLRITQQAQTVEDFLARGGRIEVLPPFQYQRPSANPVGAMWRGAGRAAA